MKLLILPLLLAGAGVGWYGRDARSSAAKAECDPADCHVTVECTDHGTCLVTCTDSSGTVRCQREVPCDGPCDKKCDEPCDSAAAKTAGKSCAAGATCTR